MAPPLAHRLVLSTLLPNSLRGAAAAALPSAALSVSRRFCTKSFPEFVPFSHREPPPYTVAVGDDERLHIRVDMPGVGKEGVELLVKPNELSIKGERKKDPETGESGAVYSLTWGIPDKFFRLHQVKAVMNDGILKVAVPMVKAEENRGD